ncbi:MAG TPA: hypothetical protein PK261_04825 [Accumulibacter sp.]|nr:hypothetical protein [Accumulibacter sp.]
MLSPLNSVSGTSYPTYGQQSASLRLFSQKSFIPMFIKIILKNVVTRRFALSFFIAHGNVEQLVNRLQLLTHGKMARFIHRSGEDSMTRVVQQVTGTASERSALPQKICVASESGQIRRPPTSDQKVRTPQ